MLHVTFDYIAAQIDGTPDGSNCWRKIVAHSVVCQQN
jgi:hypothetical protein